jgi:microcystin-dependent protein
MADAFVGEIRTFAFDRVPPGWAPCHGQFLPIAEFETLFALIGASYGGDGRSTFALPDLRGHVVVAAAAPERALDGAAAEANGSPATPARRPADDPLGTVLAPSRGLHARPTAPSPNGTVDGGHHADRRRRPHRYVGLNVCIALFGAFPSSA